MQKLKFVHSSRIIKDQYLGYSFYASLLMWLGSWGIDSSPFYQNFFLSGLLLGNLYFYYFAYGLVGASRLFFFPAYFLFQTLCLIGVSFEQETIGPLYLSIIPCAAGLYHFISKDLSFNQEHFFKGASLAVISVLMYTAVNGVTHKNLLTPREVVFVGGFVLWFAGIVFWGMRMAFKENRSVIHSILRRQHTSEHDDKESKDKYFYHDLINMTHGLNMYLGHKVSGGNSLDYHEVKTLRNEIKMIQSLIKDHYKYGHKNLFGTYEFVTFEFAKDSILKMVKSYLPDSLVDSHFVYKGMISEHADFEDSQKCLVHFPSFYRIMNNLVKNMAEDQTKEAEFVFDYDESGLSITAKSKVFRLGENNENLAKDLSAIIMGADKYSADDKANGLGLKSIANLCEEQGGEFSFSISEGYWVNSIKLPAYTQSIDKSFQRKAA